MSHLPKTRTSTGQRTYKPSMSARIQPWTMVLNFGQLRTCELHFRPTSLHHVLESHRFFAIFSIRLTKSSACFTGRREAVHLTMGARCFLYFDVTSVVSSRTDRTAALGPKRNVDVAVELEPVLTAPMHLRVSP
jgi:hypothetical protein